MLKVSYFHTSTRTETCAPLINCASSMALRETVQDIIGVARRCTGYICTPQGGEKIFFGANLQEKVVNAPPR